MSPHRILVVNPGSTTTKLGLFEDEKPLAVQKVDHPASELERFPRILDQYALRRQVMLDFLKTHQAAPAQLSAVVARGGLLKPLPSGTYRVDAKMVEDLSAGRYGEHASNIGAILAYGFQWDFQIPAFIVDPPAVDEMTDIARLSGLKEIPRRCLWHALNIMAVTRQVCAREGWDFRAENFVTAHLGGGISVAALDHGRCIDVSNGLEAGPYTPERAGTLPSIELAKLCYSGTIPEATMMRMLVGRGGLVNYLGTSNVIEVVKRIEQGDDYARLVFSGMCYQIAKEIGSYVAVLKGKVKRIILTGGAAHSKEIVTRVTGYVEGLAPVTVVPGEDELAALAQGGLRILRQEEEPRSYQDLP
ncbi:MAG: butyrate kinase [Candidatus Riflebacteria bacterium]|nr:butyrate kinase [Candidatus Riflebacteria bacterium]